MRATEFRTVIVIGYGIITEKVLKTVYEKSKEYGYSVEYIEHEVHPFNTAKRLSGTYGIKYKLLEDKAELKEHLLEAARQRMLVISASNNYIFPNLLVENKNVTIINFHNALLPDYPGRNAPSWVIYSGERETGITWHYVTGGIDEGDIIIQKKCPVQPQVRAYELAAALMELAAEAFEECYQDVLCNRVDAKRQGNAAGRRMYKSSEVPGGARFDVSDPPQDIYRLLRAIDYGKNNIFPLARTELNGNTIQIRRYRLIGYEEKRDDAYRLYIPYGGGKLLMLRYEEVFPDGLGGVVDSMEQYYGILAGLKRFKRHLLSNMYMDDKEIQEFVRDGKLFFYYAPGKYVNYWKNEWDFVRLYYYIADGDRYEAPDIKSKIVCDLFFSKKAARNDEAVGLLRHAGFQEYALFRKYVKRPDAETPLGIDEDIVPGVAEGFYELLKECFDIYTDLVPEENTARQYLEGQKCFTAVDKYGKLAGGAVISKKGGVETEEFVFVTPKMRGRGMARRLRRYAYAHTSAGTTKLASWVKYDNERSWRQLLGFGYQDSGAYKITMMKG